MAAENRLIEDVDRWMSFRAARNISSRTYNAFVARDVALIAPGLRGETKKLLAAIEERNA